MGEKFERGNEEKRKNMKSDFFYVLDRLIFERRNQVSLKRKEGK